jgi:hypothetical protein
MNNINPLISIFVCYIVKGNNPIIQLINKKQDKSDTIILHTVILCNNLYATKLILTFLKCHQIFLDCVLFALTLLKYILKMCCFL